jgi:hypothetical protein
VREWQCRYQELPRITPAQNVMTPTFAILRPWVRIPSPPLKILVKGLKVEPGDHRYLEKGVTGLYRSIGPIVVAWWTEFTMTGGGGPAVCGGRGRSQTVRWSVALAGVKRWPTGHVRDVFDGKSCSRCTGSLAPDPSLASRRPRTGRGTAGQCGGGRRSLRRMVCSLAGSQEGTALSRASQEQGRGSGVDCCT